MTVSATPPIDTEKFHTALGAILRDAAACITGALVVVGDKLGFYKALAGAGPLTSAELAQRTGTHERYVREWLANQAAAGYLTYDSTADRFSLPAEHVPILADDTSEFMLAPMFHMCSVMFADEPKVTEVFVSGRGLEWGKRDARLFSLVDRFFRNGYAAHIVQDWIPALDGVKSKLEAGASVDDVGCGYGSSSILMAKAYPKSRFTGYDYHAPSIEAAREAARQAGVSDRVRFEVAKAADFQGTGLDLVCCFDCVHDMGDPVGALVHIRQALAQDGTLMMVEPFANDTLAENINPIGRLFYGASTLICTPTSLAQEVGLGLGAQCGEARMRAVVTEAGFTRFRRATQTPFNLIYEAKA